MRLSTMADRPDSTEVSEQVFKLEGVIYYVDPQSFGSVGFLGGKERVRIPINSTHSSLEAHKRHIIQYAGLKAESENRGLGSSIECTLSRRKARRRQQSVCDKQTGTVEGNLRSGVLFFLFSFFLLLCFFGSRGKKSSRERHKGLIGKGHDLRLSGRRRGISFFFINVDSSFPR